MKNIQKLKNVHILSSKALAVTGNRYHLWKTESITMFIQLSNISCLTTFTFIVTLYTFDFFP